MSLKSQLLQQVECPICYDTLNAPKILTCYHTFCLKCLTNVVKSSNQAQVLKCPTCRTSTPLSSKGVQGLPNNYILQGMLDTIAQTKPIEEPTLCDHCHEQEISTHYCDLCKENLCKFHTKAHKKGKLTKEHQLKPLTQDATYEVIGCQKHKGEKLSMICLTCDDMLICRDCAIVPHKTHEYKFICDIIEGRRNNLKVLVDKTISLAPKLENDIAIVDQMIKEIQEKHEEEIEKNKQCCETLVNAIQKKKNDLDKELDSLRSDRIAALQTERQKLSILLDTGRCSNSSIIESYGDARLIEMEREISQQHYEMQKEMNKLVNTYANTFFESKVDVQVMLNHLTSWSVVRLDNDKKILLAAMKKNVCAMKHASSELKNNKRFILDAVKENIKALGYASDQLKKDKDFILVVMTENGNGLAYASSELKNDKEIVLAAVRNNGDSLMYASNELKNDEEIVLAAVKKNGSSFKHASKELRKDKTFVTSAVKENGNALKYATNELKNDKEVVLSAVKRTGSAFGYASVELRNDKAFVSSAVKENRNVSVELLKKKNQLLS